MLIFPIPRIGTRTTGDGAMAAAEGPITPCRPEIASTSGGGATTEACGRPSRRDVVWLTEGSGATTEVSPGAGGSFELPILEEFNSGGAGAGVTSGRSGLATLILRGLMAVARSRLPETIG